MNEFLAANPGFGSAGEFVRRWSETLSVDEGDEERPLGATCSSHRHPSLATEFSAAVRLAAQLNTLSGSFTV